MGDEEDSYPRKRCRDENTKAEEDEQTATKKPCVTTSEGLTDDAAEQHETSNVDKLGEEQHTRKEEERISEEDEGWMRKAQEKDALSLQARGEEGDEESVKKDTSVRETINDRHTNIDCDKPKLINSGDEEVKETLFMNEDSTHSSSTEENTNDKSEELKETKVDDAPVNVGEQLKQSSDQHLDEETKTEKQKQTECQKPAETSSEDLTDEVKEEQGEDIGLEKLKRDKVESTNEKSEELKETKVDDAPVNVREQLKHSSDQHLDEETKTEKQKQIGIQPQRVHYGLRNQGATCYLNSVLQVLYMTPEVHGRFNSELKTELNRVFACLKERTCGTKQITRILQIKNVHEQGDAAECLELILNKISQQDSAEIQGRLMYTTKCSKGHIINKETNPFWSLPLSLKDNHDTTYSVERSFERIFQRKTFNGHNKVHCNECNNKTEATKECEMEKYPPILTLLLKRFDYDYKRMSHYKSHCCVDVPLELKRKNQTYKLYGMVNHMGSLTSGHYTATILSNEDKTWYECSDSYVGKVKQLFKKGTYLSRTVYLLMYRECQKPAETNSEDLTDEVKEEQGEDIGLEVLIRHKVENNDVRKRDSGDEENTQMGHSEEDEGKMRQDQEKDTLSLQVRGEEGDEESVKKDTSVRETINDRNKNTGVKCATLRKVKTSADEEVQDNLFMNEDSTHSSSTEENTQMGHSEEDEGRIRKDQEKDALSFQARGEEGEVESVKKDTSVRETINDRDTNSDDAQQEQKLLNSEDKEVQETLFINEDSTHSSSREENTKDKSEELKETKVNDAPVNVEEQLKHSSEQHLDEETKTEKQKECQKPAETNSEDLTDKVKEEKGEDIGLEQLKRDKVENNDVRKRDTDDEENTQIGYSEEDEGKMRKDQEKDTLSLQARGEEGDEESVKKDTSVRGTSYYRNTNSDEDCEKQKLLNSEDEVQENLNSMASTSDVVNKSYTMKSSGDHDDSNCSAEENETSNTQVREEQCEIERATCCNIFCCSSTKRSSTAVTRYAGEIIEI